MSAFDKSDFIDVNLTECNLHFGRKIQCFQLDSSTPKISDLL